MREHSTKTTPVFLPADEEASWSLLPSLVYSLSGGTVQPENTYSHILKGFSSIIMITRKVKINLKDIKQCPDYNIWYNQGKIKMLK